MIKILIIISFVIYIKCESDNEFCYKKEDCDNELISFASNDLNGIKYLLYDVNREESFNARRKTYIELANLVLSLGLNWTLVLPPWGFISEWKSDRPNFKIQWSKFFKVEVLQEIVPVVEFSTFLEHVSNELDLILVLQKINDNEFIDLKQKDYIVSTDNCQHIQFYKKDENYFGLFFGYKELIKAKTMSCINSKDKFNFLKKSIENDFSKYKTIFIQNADLIKNNEMKKTKYWLIRRSMQFTDNIIKRANKYRRKYFDSDDEKDKTFIGDDWQLEKLNKQKKSGDAIGGNYIAIHRKLDNKNQQLNDEQTIKQIFIALKETNLTDVFVATNGDDYYWQDLNKEFNRQLKKNDISNKYKLFRYKNKSNKLLDGELELIEQWICSHARLFLGTYDSMFTNFIQEEREILGFLKNSTFIFLCNSDKLCLSENQEFIQY